MILFVNRFIFAPLFLLFSPIIYPVCWVLDAKLFSSLCNSIVWFRSEVAWNTKTYSFNRIKKDFKNIGNFILKGET